ncbi:hypothetical protein BDF20DRAFT_794149, partial [Mycotypha africana]|uniref:uncharacterized protein n=1 Tax=Mycotypha africana TaxID=64632 RepID=UPI0023015DDB
YLDDENDKVLMTCDADVMDAVKLARKMGQDRVKLFVQDAYDKAKEEEVQLTTIASAVEEIPIIRKEQQTPLQNTDEVEEESFAKGNATVTGIPQELVLPAAITFLGVVILGVFAFSRVGSNR